MAPSATHSGEEGGDLVAVSGGYMRTSVNPSTGTTETVFVPDTSTSGPPSFGDDKHAERAYLKHRLALAFRVFAAHGFAEGIAGHITLRDPVDPESFWVNPFGMHFSLIKDSDLIRVDAAGKVVDGGKNRRLNYAAFAIHHAIHTARPDVLCAAHAHSTHGRAFSAAGRALDMLHQDACIFHNDHVLYPNFAGVVLAADEGARIATALGARKAAILANHGLLTAGRSVEETVAWFVLLERCCQMQLAADASAAGRGVPLVVVGEEEARATWEAIGTSEGGYFMGLPLFQVAEKEFGESTFLGRGLEPA